MESPVKAPEREEAKVNLASPASAEENASPSGRFARVRQLGSWADPLYFVVPLLLVGLWQATVSWDLLSTQYLPAPLDVLRTTWTWVFGSEAPGNALYNGTWHLHALGSLQRVVLGFSVGAVIGIVLGFAIGWSKAGEKLFDPVVQLLRPIPITAWLPFVVVFLGTQGLSAVVLIAIGTFFPVVLNTVHGLKEVRGLLIRAAQMLGCRSRVRLLSRVGVPSALPAIFTGLRLGLGLAWVLVIVAEMVAVKAGFGYIMWDAYFFLRMDMIVAAMFSVGILGFLSDRIVVVVRNRVCSWTAGIART